MLLYFRNILLKNKEIDDMKQGILQPSRFRAPQMRLKLARFAADNAKQLEKSGILAETSAKTAREYIEAVLSPEYPGGDVDLAIAAVASGALVQVFDVRTQRLKQYGRGFVERYQNPKRLGPRGAVKLALWADGSYDPIAFCLERGMYPDRMEKPFCMAYAVF